MSIKDLLAEIEKLDRNRCDDPAKLKLGPSGAEVTHLLCVDGMTQMPASPQIKEFYRYATPWHLCGVQLIWPDPRDFPALLSREEIAEVVTDDLAEHGIEIEGVDLSNCALLAYDYLPSIYQRAYFYFSGAEEPQVIDAGSGVKQFATLHHYLEFWRGVLASG